MSGNEVAKRYAKAFFEIAKEEGKLEAYYGELTLFSSMAQSNKDLQEFFASPLFSEERKASLVCDLAQKLSLSQTSTNFLNLLVEKKRIEAVVAVQKSFEEMLDKELSKARVEVRTAFKLTDSALSKLQIGLEALTKKKVEMNIVEDPSLLGGIVVQIGDTLYDGSIKTQLNSISNLLGEER
ncbi:MAG: ATP synthase F1 subunit delta [Deltaproteobacteria bacterium]|nr:ATP synthase F1 subunit delta [Deltaproteobacteria bacterium]